MSARFREDHWMKVAEAWIERNVSSERIIRLAELELYMIDTLFHPDADQIPWKAVVARFPYARSFLLSRKPWANVSAQNAEVIDFLKGSGVVGVWAPFCYQHGAGIILASDRSGMMTAMLKIPFLGTAT